MKTKLLILFFLFFYAYGSSQCPCDNSKYYETLAEETKILRPVVYVLNKSKIIQSKKGFITFYIDGETFEHYPEEQKASHLTLEEFKKIKFKKAGDLADMETKEWYKGWDEDEFEKKYGHMPPPPPINKYFILKVFVVSKKRNGITMYETCWIYTAHQLRDYRADER